MSNATNQCSSKLCAAAFDLDDQQDNGDRSAARTVVVPNWAVAPFQSISLAQLNAKADMMERRDNKYVVSAHVLEQAMIKLAPHFDILEIDGQRDFTYDTFYFDDAAGSGYFDHHRGRRIRCKVRMRKYLDASLCFVEVKLKHIRGMTIKQRLQQPVQMYGMLGKEALEFIRASYEDLYGREFKQALQPMIEMRYQRVTLVAKEGGERMTVDIGLKFMGPSGACDVDENLFLVEAKSRNANGIADKVLRSLSQHPTNSCSKYCVAMVALKKVHKYNKFLTALRKLGLHSGHHDVTAASIGSRQPGLPQGTEASYGPWASRTPSVVV